MKALFKILSPLIITCTCTLFVFTPAVKAQGLALGSDYQTAVGLRGGPWADLTIKHFFNPNVAIEGWVGAWPRTLRVTVLVEKHQSAFGTRGLNWYYGGGGHIRPGYWGGYKYRGRWYPEYYDGVGFGVDGIVGLEFKIPEVPIAISGDLHPFLELNSAGWAGLFVDPGLGIKLTF